MPVEHAARSRRARIRRVANGRALVRRPVRPDDAPGLLDLYGRLSDEDRYLRFHSAFRPDAAFAATQATIAERDGVGLVDELVQANGHRSLVATATADRLPDGDGELGIAVDPAWRGGLGGALLDALLVAAGRAGMRNLQAEVLADNQPMLRLLRRRAVVIVGAAEGATIRLAVGASASTPGWPRGAPRPWVLGEVPGGRWRDAGRALERGGSVLTCPGPRAPSYPPCPLLVDQTCPLVDDADLVVCRLRRDDAGRAVRAAVAQVHPGAGVRLHVS